MLRLTFGDEGDRKAYFVYTSLQEPKGFEEAAKFRRSHGGKITSEGGIVRRNWFERRERKNEFLDEEPTALVAGAGQAGLSIGARLQALSAYCLLIDRNPRIGDNWRNRYRVSPISVISMIDNADTVTVSGKIGAKEIERTSHPKHVTFCTGRSGGPKVATFPGQSSFEGTIYHGSQHRDASSSSNVNGKKVVVVGTGNSGHDIAQKYYESRAAVTMVQRTPTLVLFAADGPMMPNEGLYDASGSRTEETNIYAQSFPLLMSFALAVGSVAIPC